MRRSAQRKNRIYAKARKKRALFVARLFVFPTLFLLVFVLLKITTHFWNNHDKFTFTYVDKSGDVGVTVLDPNLSEVTNLIIPGDTEVDVAGNYGTLKIGNVWKLSQNEKLKGKLLPETVTQNFLFPVFLWSERDMTDIWKYVFTPGDTNIPFGDRVMSAFFVLKAPSYGKKDINLGDTQFLRKVKLSDGSSGYRLNGVLPERLIVYFSDADISRNGVRISIVDVTQSIGVADQVGQILEALGGKVVSIEKKTPENYKDISSSGCIVFGSDKNIVKKISMLFTCDTGKENTDFDIEIWLSAEFAKRF